MTNNDNANPLKHTHKTQHSHDHINMTPKHECTVSLPPTISPASLVPRSDYTHPHPLSPTPPLPTHPHPPLPGSLPPSPLGPMGVVRRRGSSLVVRAVWITNKCTHTQSLHDSLTQHQTRPTRDAAPPPPPHPTMCKPVVGYPLKKDP